MSRVVSEAVPAPAQIRGALHRRGSHRGRILHYAGDAAIAMFEAVVDALPHTAKVQPGSKVISPASVRVSSADCYTAPVTGHHFEILVLSMLRTVLLVCLGVAATAIQAYHEASEPSDGTVKSFKAVRPPKLLPESLLVEDGAGKTIPLASYRGKVVLLNLWATWCPPCVRELPALDRLQARLGGEDFEVLTVSLDQGGAAQAAPFFERLKIAHLPLYVDPRRRLATFFPIDVLPASFIIDSQGRVTHFLRSFVDWDDPDSDKMFLGMMRRPQAADGTGSPVTD